MARGKGPLVFFARIRQGAAKAQPYLRPALKSGGKALLKALQSSIATLKTIDPKVIRSKLEKASRIAGFVTLASAQKAVPKDTGRLRSSLNVRAVSEYQFRVGTNVRYALAVEDGRKGGKLIEPVKAKALVFRWKGAPPGIRKKFKTKGARK